MKKYSAEAKELLSQAELFEIKAGSSGRSTPEGPTCRYACVSCVGCTQCLTCTSKVFSIGDDDPVMQQNE